MPRANGINADVFAAKLRELSGNVAAVARFFGVTRQSADKYMRRRPSLLKIAGECRETMRDNAESALYNAVLAGEPWAVMFFLRTQAKSRGYVERTEVTGQDGRPIEEVVEVVIHSRAEAETLLPFINRANGLLDGPSNN
jgi:hypothetical protein